jgi:tetratricopeptide (TPR) repeat protein
LSPFSALSYLNEFLYYRFGVPSNRDAEQGLERLRAVVRANPRSTTFVALAHALCDAGRATEAEEVCRQGLAQHPRLVTGQVALGRALIDRGRLSEAQEVLVEAARASPENGDAFRWLGDAVLRRGDRVRALAILEFAEELLPTDAQVAEVLVRAGGTPLARGPRPKTDFEQTRVANARALADRMHEDPSAPEPAARDELDDDPTIVGPSALVPSTAAPLPGPASDAAAALAATNGAPNLVASGAALPPRRSTAEGASGLATAASTSIGTGLPTGGATGQTARPWVTFLRKWGGLRPVVAGRAALKAAAARLRRRPRLLAGALAAPLVLVLLGVLFWTGGQGTSPPDSPAAELRAALADGTQARLEIARVAGKRLLQTRPVNGDVAAAVAMVNALLALDYGLPTAPDIEEAAEAAASAHPPSLSRTGILEGARALAALAAGKLNQAREHAAKAIAASPESIEARLASARVRLRSGELESARGDLQAALASDPHFASAVIDWAELCIDLGDPMTAVSSLRSFLEGHKAHLPAHLMLAEAEQAAGARGDPGALRVLCQRQGSDARILRARCALADAAAARLAGERVAAARAARAAVIHAGREPRVLARAAALLAVLGEVDAAASALAKTDRLVEPAFVPRSWAEMAIALGRGQTISSGPLLDRPSSPEARLVVARAAYAQGGPGPLAAAVRKMGPASVAFDPDLKALAALAGAGNLTPSERTELETRAEKGDPVAAYVLGRRAHNGGDVRNATRRLEKALQGHGDACTAGRLLGSLTRGGSRPPALNAAFRALRARNSRCDLGKS